MFFHLTDQWCCLVIFIIQNIQLKEATTLQQLDYPFYMKLIKCTPMHYYKNEFSHIIIITIIFRVKIQIMFSC